MSHEDLRGEEVKEAIKLLSIRVHMSVSTRKLSGFM
jgi:hypothetical protein